MFKGIFAGKRYPTEELCEKKTGLQLYDDRMILLEAIVSASLHPTVHPWVL